MGGHFFDSLKQICRSCQDTQITPAMVVISVLIVAIVGALILRREHAEVWCKKWVNMGQVRIMYTTCQVLQI